MQTYFDRNGNKIVNANKIALLDIAIEQFSLKGFAAISIRDITKQAGIKESSFYNHFRSKDELLETIFLNFRISIEKIMPSMDQVDEVIARLKPQAFLHQGVRYFMDHISAPKMEQIWRIIYLEQCRNAMAREIVLTYLLHHTIDFLTLVFHKYMELGEVRGKDAKLLAIEYQYPLFTMINEYILLRLDDQITEAIEQRMGHHVDYFSEIMIIRGETIDEGTKHLS